MNQAYYPFRFSASQAVVDVFGHDLRTIALLSLQAVFRNRKGLEVAHQQVSFRDHTIALSTRISPAGVPVLYMELGTPGLTDRVILEEELRAAHERRRRVNPRRRWGSESNASNPQRFLFPDQLIETFK